MKYDYLIVGAGITGSTIARILAEAGEKVLIIDKRQHIGGNCYDDYDEHGILIHKYGPHILHTNHKKVWDFLSRFTEWRHYQHTVRAFVDGKLVPFPINTNTLKELYGLSLDASGMKDYLDEVKTVVEKVENSRDSVISRIGAELYEKFFMNYTRKQWGIPAEELHPSVCERIPVRFNSDDRYFTDIYQGMPLYGYRKLFENMLFHRNIHIALQTDYADAADSVKCDAVIYTGPIDEYFGYAYGRLGYRSIKFEFKNYQGDSFLEYAVVNYPNDYDFTRIAEYKKLTGQTAVTTTVSYEYPCGEGEPYYPIPSNSNQNIYSKYEGEAGKIKNIFFAGRLGSYRYMNMDIACLEAMILAERLLA